MQQHMKTRTAHTEFPDWVEPEGFVWADLKYLGFEDNSWHNDIMPSFFWLNKKNPKKSIVLWVDYPEDESEFAEIMKHTGEPYETYAMYYADEDASIDPDASAFKRTSDFGDLILTLMEVSY